jgi:outer membrane receptor protein involved in Fe transport
MQNSRSYTAGVTGLMLVAAVGVAYGPGAGAQEASGSGVEEITVTAQKRSEALSDIPMSVTVLGGERLEHEQILNFEDLVSSVPGFSINGSTYGQTRLTLRGVNTGGVASTVGVYVDDTPFGSSSGLANGAVVAGDFDTFDLARIEVLRGPQGTLYGASSLGGVLKYVTNAPNTDKFEARGQGSLESVKGGDLGFAATGAVNVPVNDTFALRGTGFYRSDDGFIDSIGNNPIPSLTDPANNAVDGTIVDDDVNDLDSYGGRIQALFEPNDRFSARLVAQFQDLEAGAPNHVDADPVTLEEIEDNVQSRYQEQETDTEYRIYSGTLEYDFGFASLQSVTSYGTFEQDFHLDGAANTSLGGIAQAQLLTLVFGDPATMPLSSILDQTTSTDKFTQEARLISAENERLEWLLGVYYTNEDSKIEQAIFAVESGTETLAAGIPAVVDGLVDSDYEEIAVFGNATWHITDRLELSAGGRGSWNDQTASQVLEGALFTALGLPPQIFDDADSSESPVTWSVSPRFEFTDDVSAYARVATGFRPGGPNVIQVGAPPGTPATYDSDSLTSYEIGVKAATSDGRFALDITGFLLDWDDVQLLAVINGIGLNANGGTAKSKGFEFSASAAPVEGLTLSLNGAYTDAYLTEDTDPIVGGLDGDPLSFVPEWSFGVDGEYEWTVMDDKKAYLGGNVGYTGDRPADFNNRDAAGELREAESYTTLNMRAGLDAGQWYVQVYARNLTDAEGVTDIIGEGSYPNGAVALGLIRPRTFGVSVGARF